MTWKKVNQSDAGTASKFGGNDVDKISDAFSGVDVDDFDINCDFTVRDDKFKLRNPANTFSYVHSTGAISANRNINYPVLTSDDEPVFKSHAVTLTNKTADIRDNPLILRENSYLVFKDGSTYYARNGTTGALTSNTAFSTILQGIIDAIPTRDDTVFTKIKIAPGTYDVNTVITIADKYNLSIEGSGMGITRIQAGPSLGATSKILDIKGSVSGSSKSLTSNAAANQKTAVMSSGDASTLAANDWVLLRSTLQYGSGGSASGAQGEIKQIASVAGGTITFREPLYDTYNTANSASIIELLPMRNLSMSNFTLGRHASYAGTDAQWWHMFLIDRISVDRVEVVDYPGDFGGAMMFKSCTNAKISNCHMQQNIAYNFQYGISFHSCCQDCVVTNCTSWGDWRHPFEAGSGETGTNEEGVCRNIMFSNCTATGGSQNAFDTHPEGENINFVNCGALGTNDGGGFKLRSKYSSIINCIVKNANQSSSGQHAIMISDDALDCIISNCYVTNCNAEGIKVKDGCDGTVIQGNVVKFCTGDGIHIDTGGALRTCVRDNTVTNNTLDGLDALDADSMIITGNQFRNNGGWGIKFEAATCTNNVIANNQFSGNTSGTIQNGAQTGNKESNNLGYP